MLQQPHLHWKALINPAPLNWTLLAFALLLGCSGGETASSGPNKTHTAAPNFLILLPDSLRADRPLMQKNGAPLAPNLHALAHQGITFDKAISQAGWTIPALAALLTGRYPVMPQPEAKTLGWMDANDKTFPQVLSLYGYRTTGFIGADSQNLVSAFGPRFDDIVVASGQQPPARGAATELAQWLQSTPKEPFVAFAHDVDLRFVASPEELSNWPTNPQKCAKERKPGSENKPVDIVALHGCLDTSEEDTHRIITESYDRTVAEYDQGVGEIVTALRDSGLSDRTIIVLTSPHGHHLGENGRYVHNTLYEPDLHIPLIWVEPDGKGAGTHIQSVVQSLDLAPTLVARAGATAEAGMNGRSLLPLWDQGMDEASDIDVFSVNDPGNLSVRSGFHKLIRLPQKKKRPGGHIGREKFVLFDLKTDPLEQNDLQASNPPPEAKILQAKLHAFTEELMSRSRSARDASGTQANPELRIRLKEQGYWDHVKPDAEPTEAPKPAP